MNKKSFLVFLVIFYIFYMSAGSIPAKADGIDVSKSISDEDGPNVIDTISVEKKNIIVPNWQKVIVTIKNSNGMGYIGGSFTGVKDMTVSYKLPSGSYTQVHLSKDSSSDSSFYGYMSTYYSETGEWTVANITEYFYNGGFRVYFDKSEGGSYELDGGNYTVYASDTAGPVFKSVSVDKSRILVGGSSTVTVEAEDILSGIQSVSLEYLFPNNNYISVTAESIGNNQYQFSFPSYLTSENYGMGKFDLVSITIKDNLNNATSIYDYSYYRTGDLSGGDFTTVQDTEGPVLNSVSVDKTKILTGDSVTITINAVDEFSDVENISLNYSLPNGWGVGFNAQYIGNNQFQAVFPSFITTGDYGLGKFELTYVTLTDTKNNSTVISDSKFNPTGILDGGDFTVMPESDPPTVKSISVDKKEILSGNSVKLIAEVDDASGVKNVSATLLKPDGNTYTLTLTHSHDNVFEAVIPENETVNGVGNWSIYNLWVNDIYDNSTYIWSNLVNSWGEDLTGANFHVNERDITPPYPPSASSIDENSTLLSGYSEPGATVSATVNGVLIGSAIADSNGYYEFSIVEQAAKSQILITATDSSGNTSQVTRIIVKDVTPPAKPEVDEIYDNSTYITGHAEPGSNVYVYANDHYLGSSITNESGVFSIEAPSQSAGTELHIYVADDSGNTTGPTIIVVKDGTAPEKPEVSGVTEHSSIVTGSAETGSLVEVKKSGDSIGSVTADSDGKFEISIPVQPAGTKLEVTATDKAGNVSEGTTVVVKDVTAPGKVTVIDLTDQDIAVSGEAEAGTTVEVFANSSLIGKGTAGIDGKFSINIQRQKAGTELVVTSTDNDGNISEATTVVVKDATAPDKPIVYEVTDKDTSVTGQAEAGSEVKVKVNDTVIGTGTTGENGHYQVDISAQKAGTELVVIATDTAGNVSETTTIVVKDATAPEKPVVNQVSDKDTTVAGQTEAGSTIEVKKSGSVIGAGTAGEDGQYLVAIPMQKAGTELVIVATDAAGNISSTETIKVTDKTAPSVLTVNSVSDKSKEVTGKTEVGATISVKIGTKIYAAKADTNGNFKVIIPAQKAGTKLIVTAKDAAGNVSAAKSISVLDKTAPVTPSVTTISDQAKVVTGKAEAGSIVTILIGTKKYIAKADAKGNFKVTIPVQKAGTKVIVTAKDAAGNVSVAKSVIVIDKTAPTAPKIKTTVRSTTKEVTGTSEAYSTITIKVGSKVIGTAKADSKGNFKVKIKAQKKNTILIVTATDKAKNVSKATTVKVK
ncbi:Ig-like domain-containing protein [Neobacillus sp. SuZ13]|uniref:Ig-like domain-containing protein n=1 Tax=Neobacillus sp. SuZ13 TaxID=3047875 RepID=UPI0024C0B570|nr:Ig-like domain-containing protein [Neobacillus sp. SuZ13]WHY66778.1 Ig-like domain-containing protein [Neobacillus sp. SuZ13]